MGLLIQASVFLFFILLSGFSPSDEIPETNKLVLDYVERVKNKKVDRGECWDLLKQALDYAEADWKFPNTWGRKYNPRKETPLAGDCLQYSNAVFKYMKGNVEYTSKAPKHSSIIYEVLSPTEYLVAEQNANGIRKVKINPFNLDHLKKGKVDFFRPLP